MAARIHRAAQRGTRSTLRPASIIHLLEPRRLFSAGDIDFTFGSPASTGVVTDFLGDGDDRGRAAVVQADGKTVVVASVERPYDDESAFGLLRFNPDGSLDTSFGDGGRVVFDFGGRYAVPVDVALAPGGEIVVAGISAPSRGFFPSDQDFAIARLNPDGSLDRTFDLDGKVLVDFDRGTDVAAGVAVRPDGRVLVGGFSDGGTPRSRSFALAQLNSDGTLDRSFGGDGTVTTRPGPLGGRINDLALDADGRAVVAGGADRDVRDGGSTVSYQDFAAARYNPDGSLDRTFGGDGVVATPLPGGGFDMAQGVALGPGGTITIAGTSRNDIGVVRYTADGSLDASLDGDGILLVPGSAGGGTSVVGLSDAARGMVSVDGAGRTVLGATFTSSGPFHKSIVLLRLDPAGAPDPTFGGDGRVDGGAGESLSLARGPGDRITVVGGTPATTGFDDVVVERYGADGAPDASFGTNGRATAGFVASTTDQGSAVAVQADGKIIVGGTRYAGDLPGGSDFTLVRYLSDGSLDETFGDRGRAGTDGRFQLGTLNAIALQRDGRVVAAGNVANPATGGQDFAVVRWGRDGRLDSTFGDGGVRVVNFPSSTSPYATAYDLAVQDDGAIVVAGVVGGGFALARLDGSGNLDRSFDGDGRVLTPIGATGFPEFPGWSRATSVALGPGGTIVAAGPYGSDVVRGGAFAVARYDASGQLDGSFGTRGVSYLFADGAGELPVDVAVDADGSVVVGTTGYSSSTDRSDDFVLMRLLPDGSVDTSFGGGGTTPGGVVRTNFDGGDDRLRSLLLLPDGSIIAVGAAGNPLAAPSYRIGDGSLFGVARYTPAGELDSSFGEGGKVTTGFGGFGAETTAAALYPDDRLVVAGTSITPGRGSDFATVRYDLRPDPPPPERWFLGAHVFYNGSAYDGRDTALNAADDAAIATDKAPLFAGDAATFSNVTSYPRGINGVMFDVERRQGMVATWSARYIRADDMDDTRWQPTPAATTGRRLRADRPSVTRFSIAWPDGVIRNAWVELTVNVYLRNDLVAHHVFAFGNLVGETGDAGSAAGWRVSALDLAVVKRAMNTNAGIDSHTDVNRDGRVNALDLAAVRSNLNHGLPLLDVPPEALAAGAALGVERVWREDEFAALL